MAAEIRQLLELVAWAVGAGLFAYFLHKRSAHRFRSVFLYLGYLVAFALLFRAAFWLSDRPFPAHLPNPSISFQARIPENLFDEISVETLVEGAASTGNLVLRQLESVKPDSSTGFTLEGAVDGVADGDTITLQASGKRYRIRLHEIDAPELNQAWGDNAKRALSRKVNRRWVRLDVTDQDDYGRYVAKIWLGTRDINRELVREGHAWVYRRYMKDRTLLDDEQVAKSAKLGLWSAQNPIAPWHFRHARH